MKNQMTQEQMMCPRQFSELIEETTGFYSHTGDGGNACFASADDSIEEVWLETKYSDMKFEKAKSVRVYVPGDYDSNEFFNLIQDGKIDEAMAMSSPSIEFNCTTVDEIIAAFKAIGENC